MTVILVDDGAGNGPHRSHVPHMLRWLVFAVIRLTRPPAINKMEMVGLCVFAGKKWPGAGDDDLGVNVTTRAIVKYSSIEWFVI